MTIGALLAALGYSLFQVPYNIAAGGIGGLSIIINHFTGWPQGMLFFVMNIPLLAVGFFYLGRWPFVVRTVVAVLIFSVATDMFLAYLPGILPEYPLTQDVLLSAIYGGLVGGIGVVSSIGPAARWAEPASLAGSFRRKQGCRSARFICTPTD